MESTAQIIPAFAGATSLLAPEGRADFLVRHPLLSRNARKLAGQWLEAAGERMIPRKRDLRPECIGRALANILIYEYESREMIRFRLAGSAFRVIHGKELTGTNFLDLIPEAGRHAASLRLHSMIGHPCGITVVNTVRFASGRKGEFRSVGLPMTDDQGVARYSIHISEYLSGRTLPSYGEVESLGAAQPAYLDLGAGIPHFDAPV